MKSPIAAVALAASLAFGFGTSAANAQTQQMSLICDLGGVAADMNIVLEYVSDSGVIWGSGPNRSITGVVPTGDYNLYTAGEVRSPNAHYTFRGEGAFAEFTNMLQPERFRVRFVPEQKGLWMIINPFQPPEWQGRHFCQYAG